MAVVILCRKVQLRRRKREHTMKPDAGHAIAEEPMQESDVVLDVHGDVSTFRSDSVADLSVPPDDPAAGMGPYQTRAIKDLLPANEHTDLPPQLDVAPDYTMTFNPSFQR